MTSKYEKFKNIPIWETGLIRNKSNICNILVNKNGIISLADLFEKDDRREIDYDYNFYSKNYHREYIRAIIRLIRFKYLQEDLIGDIYLEKEYHKVDILTDEFGKEMAILGFTPTEARQIIEQAHTYKDEFTLKDIILSSNLDFTGTHLYSQDILLTKINLLKEYIIYKEQKANKIEYPPDLNSLLKEERRLIDQLINYNSLCQSISARLSEIQKIKENAIHLKKG